MVYTCSIQYIDPYMTIIPIYALLKAAAIAWFVSPALKVLSPPYVALLHLTHTYRDANVYMTRYRRLRRAQL